MNKEHEAWIVSQLDLVDKQEAEIERLRLEFTHSARTCEMLQADNERLHKEMTKRLRQQGEAWAADVKRKDAEIERLRGLLRVWTASAVNIESGEAIAKVEQSFVAECRR